MINTGAETRPGAIARRDERDGHGQNPPRERAPGPRQVQDAARDPQGQHQAACGPVREYVNISPMHCISPPHTSRLRYLLCVLYYHITVFLSLS